MRIALVSLRTNPTRGGAERYTTDLAGALARAGHDVALVAASFARVPAGVATVTLKARGITRVARYEGFLSALDVHLDATEYDVVHAMLPVRRCDAYHPHAGIARANVMNDAMLTRIVNPRRARGAAVERRLLESPQAPVVLCLSDYVKRAVQRCYDIADSRLPVVFNGVDLNLYAAAADDDGRHATRARFGIGHDDCAALFVGQDFERKGLREAIAALARVPPSGDPGGAGRVLLLIAGSARVARYQALARDLGVGERVLSLGHREDAAALYRAADFLVLPTKHDPCSLVVLEALASGLPVISTRFNGACEVMTDGMHGFVLQDPADVPMLADAMSKMLDTQLRRRMARACVELRPRLSFENHFRALLGVYQNVIMAKSSRSPDAAGTPPG